LSDGIYNIKLILLLMLEENTHWNRSKSVWFQFYQNIKHYKSTASFS